MVMDIWRPRVLRRLRPLSMMEEMERLMESEWPFPAMWRRTPTDGMAWAPAVDLYEKEDAYVVRAELCGVKMEDVSITMSGDTLTLKGERKAPEDVKDEEFQCSEICYGSFTRSFTFSQPVDADKIEATMADGILEIRLPKAAEAKPAKIEIKARKAAK